MPNLPTHIEVAWRAAGSIQDTRITENLGCYLLGATAPDVRIITKRPRTETHFFDLESGQAGDGSLGLLTAYPELTSPSSDAQAAFVAGYITHLVADETWITSMYRRFFDGTGTFDSNAAAQLFDRAAQLSLDRASEHRVRSLLNTMHELEAGLAAGPLQAGTLSEWRVWVLDFLADARPYSWQRLRHMAGRISGHDSDQPVHQMAERFLADVRGGLRELFDKVPEAELERYLEVTVDNLVRSVTEYLRSVDRGVQVRETTAHGLRRGRGSAI